MNLVVTGGAGFIGSNFVRWVLDTHPGVSIVTLDAMTYAGNAANLAGLDPTRHRLVVGDVRNPQDVQQAMVPGTDAVVHFAAQTHVDRSILSASDFVTTNVVGTQVVVDAVRAAGARLVQISTDEVYGSLAPDAPPFTERHPLAPTSPYAASKAAADLLVGAAVASHGLDAVITRASNNYGPYQFPEKFIPLFITNALAGEPLPLYGDGRQVRDWIHVEDHCRAIWTVLLHGQRGQVYNVGARTERDNQSIAHQLLDQLGTDRARLVHVADRPAHDRRYAMDPQRIETELHWRPVVPFDEGLAATIAWYRTHEEWWRAVKSGAYRDYYQQQYGSRLS